MDEKKVIHMQVQADMSQIIEHIEASYLLLSVGLLEMIGKMVNEMQIPDEAKTATVDVIFARAMLMYADSASSCAVSAKKVLAKYCSTEERMH